jgi:hypothetical protein
MVARVDDRIGAAAMVKLMQTVMAAIIFLASPVSAQLRLSKGAEIKVHRVVFGGVIVVVLYLV